MHNTSLKYKEILTGPYRVEAAVIINHVTYRSDHIYSLRTRSSVFAGSKPSIGGTVSAEIDLRLYDPANNIPDMAKIRVLARVANDESYSEWIPKGTFYIDTRSEETLPNGKKSLTIHGYDKMLFAENDYPDTTHEWPYADLAVVKEIASFLNLPIDPDTEKLINKSHLLGAPIGYSCREVLGYIATMYAGSFVISDEGYLRLIQLGKLPAPMNYLATEYGDIITVGGEEILV